MEKTKSLMGRKFGPNARLELLTEENLVEMYKVLSMAEIGQVTGIARSSVSRFFHEYGLETRTAGHHAPHGHLKGRYLDNPTPPARPVATRRRIELSNWRLYVLAGRCPWTCPYLDECDLLTEDLTACELEQFLDERGELDRRPWEPEDYRDQIIERLGQKSAKSLEADDHV